MQAAPGVWIGDDRPAGWLPVGALPLLVLVGFTASGKSTIMAALAQSAARYTLLPGRRLLTDRVVVEPLQRRDGSGLQPLGRVDRFPYVRRFLESYPGGMGQILSWIAVAPGTPEPLVFESLRGVNELQAAAALPMARFVLLDAPDALRVQRLCRRADPHDRLADQQRPAAGVPAGVVSFASLGVPEAATLLDAGDERTLCEQVRSGELRAEALHDALRIVVTEDRMYHVAATRACMLSMAPERALVLDTRTLSPQAAAHACSVWMIPQ